MKYFFTKFKNKKDGMTIIELVVVLAIITVLTGVIIFNHGSFRSSVSTQNLVNDIALSIRKAQSYAIGVKGLGTEFNYGHGIHFSTATQNVSLLPPAGSNKSMVLFTDISNNATGVKYNYDGSNNCDTPTSSNECKEILTIDSNDIGSSDYISGFYLDGSSTKVSGILDIVFKRPNPDAVFCYYIQNANNTAVCNSDISSVKIEISNNLTGTKKITKTITVWNTGQISVASN